MLVQAQEACGPLELDNALLMVRGLEKDMQGAKASAEEGKLKPLPGETVNPLHYNYSMMFNIFLRVWCLWAGSRRVNTLGYMCIYDSIISQEFK